jgi:hypothetical protein
MGPVRDSLTPIGGGRLGADVAADPNRWRIELPPAVRDEIIDLADKRAGRTAALDNMAPKTSPTTAEFVSRLRDIFTSGCYFRSTSTRPSRVAPLRRGIAMIWWRAGGGHE